MGRTRAAAGRGEGRGGSAVLIASVWHGHRTADAGPALDSALRLARRNGVQGALARVYPDLLGAELERVAQGNAVFRQRLGEAVGRLQAGGVDPILIKCDPSADFVYSNFDLVVGADGWARALGALDGWASRFSGHRLEPDKLIVHPPTGPAAHLHRDASWFGVVAVEAAALRRHVRRDPGTGVLRPDPTDELRLLLAHAVFQNLAVDLAELLSIRGLLAEGADTEEARRRCQVEGWAAGFGVALDVARRTMAALDAGEPVPLPAPLPPLASLRDGVLHAAHLVRAGRAPMALREIALRAPLVAAKARRRAIDRRVRLVGVSGPDGSGKTTLVAALRGEAEVERARVISVHPYGCVICRRWPVPSGNGTEAVDGQAVLPAAAQRAHAMLDAAELDLRIFAARAWLRLRGIAHGGRPALVITDRTPLDTLAKHSAAGPRVTRRLRDLARRYDRILLLDADGEVLAQRDGEHSLGELTRQRARFLQLLPATGATRIDSSGPFSDDLVGSVVREVVAGG